MGSKLRGSTATLIRYANPLHQQTTAAGGFGRSRSTRLPPTHQFLRTGQTQRHTGFGGLQQSLPNIVSNTVANFCRTGFRQRTNLQIKLTLLLAEMTSEIPFGIFETKCATRGDRLGRRSAEKRLVGVRVQQVVGIIPSSDMSDSDDIISVYSSYFSSHFFLSVM